MKFEHNLWSYIFFFIHLQETRANDYTTLENHVANEVGRCCSIGNKVSAIIVNHHLHIFVIDHFQEASYH